MVTSAPDEMHTNKSDVATKENSNWFKEFVTRVRTSAPVDMTGV